MYNDVCTFLTVCAAGVAVWQWWRRNKADRKLTDLRGQLKEREKKVQTILDNAPIVFSAIDKNGIFRISEGKGLEKLGRKNNQSVGLSIYQMHGQNPIILDAVQKSLAGEQVASSFSLNGIFYELFMVPERDANGAVIGVSMLSVDISDRKMIEEEKAMLLIREKAALETSKLKSEFLATMSHEIRTPINGILGMSSLLLDTELNLQQNEYADAIRRSGDALLVIINDILDLSKIEAGKLELEEIHFDLLEVLKHALKNLAIAATSKGIRLVLADAPNLHNWVCGDPGRFRQILNNLIGNAIKFTDVGHVTVRVTCLSEQSHAPILRVEIQDTGIGIPKETLSRLFVPFSQAESSMARRFGGTGLGLSISKQLVEKMNGEIGVDSVEGSGSTFWFTLRLKEGVKPKADPHQDAETASNLGLSPKCAMILVAEDNQINQTITVRMLKNMGHKAAVAANGLEALKALENFDFDLVLMDCQMPEMDGLEAARQFRAATHSRNRGIPILAVTANAMKSDEAECLAAGMNDYVSKPVTQKNLTVVVAKWLAARRRRAAGQNRAA